MQFEPLNYIVPRQRKAKAAVNLIRETTEELIAKCKKMVSETAASSGIRTLEWQRKADGGKADWLFVCRWKRKRRQQSDSMRTTSMTPIPAFCASSSHPGKLFRLSRCDHYQQWAPGPRLMLYCYCLFQASKYICAVPRRLCNRDTMISMSNSIIVMSVL